jgi:hypothetical protein
MVLRTVNLPRGGVKKSLYGTECFDRPVLIAPPIRHFGIGLTNRRYVRLPTWPFSMRWGSS